MVPVAGFKVIGVVGLGIMGTGIAQVAAMADYDVVALDSEKSLVDRSIARIALLCNGWSKKAFSRKLFRRTFFLG